MSFQRHQSAFVEMANPVEAQCLGKEAFTTPALAWKVIRARHKAFPKGRRMPERKTPREPYHCTACRCWHIGPLRYKPRQIRENHKGPIR
ncbi:hypothetical protein ACFOHK_08415 [Falsigemmobacter intermedius]|uniref:Uncharacterized protein n=1 Tax=Falsigemmobacter intermedius TaxID=1553448 RepID=A0A3S4XH89_9RHOB|nr:hypothetical protein [Falsigemmobacter intermedius]RWY36393.1 hypothetical protein EP867_18130 [Falsigemmobacter intermedius]